MTAARDPHGIDPDDETRALDADPSVDTLISQLSGVLGLGGAAEGWGEINDAAGALKKQRTEQAARLKKDANIFRDTFMTEPGRKCLALMREMTLDADPYPSEAMLPIEAITALVIAHTAQCKFVWAIFQAIAQAENREATARTVKP